MAEKKSFDPKDHAVLGHWPEANYACLMLNGANDKKFVAAYGYDPEAKDWSQGHYYATASEAWNHADPEVIERLSEPVRVRDVMTLFEDAGIEGAGREDALEYAGNCCMAINSVDHSSYDFSWSHEIEDVREWWAYRDGEEA